MSEPILVTGAAGGSQGSTGRRIAALLLEKGIPVRAFVHKLDARSDALRELGAEVVQGDLLDAAVGESDQSAVGDADAVGVCTETTFSPLRTILSTFGRLNV